MKFIGEIRRPGLPTTRPARPPALDRAATITRTPHTLGSLPSAPRNRRNPGAPPRPPPEKCGPRRPSGHPAPSGGPPWRPRHPTLLGHPEALTLAARGSRGSFCGRDEQSCEAARNGVSFLAEELATVTGLHRAATTRRLASWHRDHHGGPCGFLRGSREPEDRTRPVCRHGPQSGTPHLARTARSALD